MAIASKLEGPSPLQYCAGYLRNGDNPMRLWGHRSLFFVSSSLQPRLVVPVITKEAVITQPVMATATAKKIASVSKDSACGLTAAVLKV